MQSAHDPGECVQRFKKKPLLAPTTIPQWDTPPLYFAEVNVNVTFRDITALLWPTLARAEFHVCLPLSLLSRDFQAH